jgi:hypothetical protein
MTFPCQNFQSSYMINMIMCYKNAHDRLQGDIYILKKLPY